MAVQTRLKTFQHAQETTWGTAVAATIRMAGLKDVKLKIHDVVELLDELGRMGPSAQAVEKEQWGEGSIEAYGSFEDIIYLLAAIFGDVTPSGGPNYLWTFAAPNATAPTPIVYSGEIGASGASYVAKGLLFTKLSIKADASGLWMVSADFIARSVTTVSLASLSDRSYEAIRMADTGLYVDAIGGTIGTTLVAASLINFEVSIETGRNLKMRGGSISPQGYSDDKFMVSGSVSVEWNSTTKAYLDALIAPAKVAKLFEIRATSSAKIAKLQLVGYLDGGVDLWDDDAGVMSTKFSINNLYDSTYGNYFKTLITNTIPDLL